MLFSKLKGIIYILNQNDCLLKANYFKEIKLYFRTCSFEKNVLFLQMNCRIFWVCKICHVSFDGIETYLHRNMGDKGKKANFRKACQPFLMLQGQLMCNNTRLVIFSTERQHTIISDVHNVLGHDSKAKAMASHCGRVSVIQKISNRFFWHNIKSDVEGFIKKCDQYQKQRKTKKVSSELCSITH